MKNNKKIYVLTLLIAVVCHQEMSAMGSAQKVAQHLWNYKFALVGTGFIGKAVLEYQNSREWVKQEVMKAIHTSPKAFIPPHEAPRLLKSLGEVVDTIPDGKLFFIRYQDYFPIPCIESSRIGNLVCFRINEAGQLALLSKQPNRFGFCSEDLYPIIKHENQHMASRHVEGKLSLTAAFTPFNFFTGVGAYKAVAYAARKVSGPKQLVGHCVAAGIGLGAYWCARTSNYSIKKAYDRHCEIVADEAVLRSDEKLIKVHKSLLERAQKISLDLNQGQVSEETNPLTDSERISAAQAELVRRETVKK
jgi:hypothetical protein